MRHERGFTMIEAAVVVAIVAILAGMGFFVARAGRANANMASAAYELAIRLTGQRAEALADGVDRVVVLVDAPGNDASSCGTFNSASCLRYFVLRNPTAAWTLADGVDRVVVLVDAPGNDASSCGTFNSASCLRYFVLRDPANPWKLDEFDPASPVAHAAEILEQRSMPTGVRLHIPARGAHPMRPFQAVTILDAALTGQCAGRTCYAVRFTGDGDVRPVYPDPTTATPVKTGLALVLGSNATSESNAGETKGIVVGFPSGIVRTFPY